MPIDPVTGYLIAQLVGPMLSGLFGPDTSGQELSSFEGHAGVGPIEMLRNSNTITRRIGQGVTDRAATPISLPSSYVQQPSNFTGGGLPMPIGVVGSDPALANPSLLSLQGLGQFQDIFSGLSSDGGSAFGVPKTAGHATPTGAGVQPGDAQGEDFYGTNNNIDTGAFDDFYQPEFSQPSNADGSMPDGLTRGTPSEASTTRRKAPAQLVRGADLLAEDSSGDDLQKAIGAAKLLMQSMGNA